MSVAAAKKAARRQRQGLAFLMKEELSKEVDQFWNALGERVDFAEGDEEAQRSIVSSLCALLAAPRALTPLSPASRSTLSLEAFAASKIPPPSSAPPPKECDMLTKISAPTKLPPVLVPMDDKSLKTRTVARKNKVMPAELENVEVKKELHATVAIPEESAVTIPAQRSEALRQSIKRIKEAKEAKEANKKDEELSPLMKAYSRFCPLPVIRPDSPQRLGWDLYMMVLILYYAVAVPVRVGFDIDPPYEMLENIFSLCFGFDMVLNFNTALVEKGEVFTSRWIIAKDYFRCWFWIDLVASFPFEMAMPKGEPAQSKIVSEVSRFLSDASGDDGGGGTAGVNKLGRLGKIFRLLRIMKLLRLLKLGRIMKRAKSLTEGNPNAVTLVKTLAYMAAILHWTACGYWFVVMSEGDAVRQEHPEANWWHPPQYIVDPDDGEPDFNLQYAYAFFWGVSVTMGCGWDIIPGTKIEVAFSSLMIMVGAMLYITLLGTVTTIVSNLNAEQSKRIGQLESVMSFLKKRMVPKVAFKRVREYYEFMWEGTSAGSEPQRQLDLLPSSLQIQLASEMHKNLLSQIPVFKSLGPEAAFYLVKCWERVIYVPNDVIVRKIGADRRLYILIRGKVRIFLCERARRGSDPSEGEEKKNPLFFLTDLVCGNFFGERAMLDGVSSDQEKNQTAIAVTYSELLYISKESFTQLVEQFHLEDTVKEIKKTYQARRAKMRWRVAIAIVRVVVTLMLSRGKKKEPIESPMIGWRSMTKKRSSQTLGFTPKAPQYRGKAPSFSE